MQKPETILPHNPIQKPIHLSYDQLQVNQGYYQGSKYLKSLKGKHIRYLHGKKKKHLRKESRCTGNKQKWVSGIPSDEVNHPQSEETTNKMGEILANCAI